MRLSWDNIDERLYRDGVDKLRGLRASINLIDEWLSGDVREDVVGAVEQGASIEGTVRSSDLSL